MASTSNHNARHCSATCDTELALDIALSHIARNGLIDDRATKLTCRLVSRDWRIHNAFSDTITLVTLHSLNDAAQLVKYFPLTPCIRSPWKTLEESRIFPQLRSIHMSLRPYVFHQTDYDTTLAYQLKDFAELESFKAACAQFELSVELSDFGNLDGEISLLASIGSVSSLQVGESWEDENRCWPPCAEQRGHSIERVDSLLRLEKLTHLTLNGFRVRREAEKEEAFRVLRELDSLRYLKLDITLFEIEDLTYMLVLLGRLTQVTDLDLTVGMEDVWQDGTVDITAVEKPLQLHAPPSLKRCVLHQTRNRVIFTPDEGSIRLDHAAFRSGKLHDLHAFVEMKSENNRLVDSAFEDFVTNVLPARDVQRVCFQVCWTNSENPIFSSDNLVFGSAALNNLKELELQITGGSFHDFVLFHQPIFFGPNFSIPFVTQLTCRCRDMRADYTNLVSQLPSYFSHLRELRLYRACPCPDNLHVLGLLTGLTRLTLDESYCAADGCQGVKKLILNLSGLPPLLKDLELNAFSLDPAPAPPLLHLTRLVLVVRQKGNLLASFRNSHAPLRDLTLAGQDSLDSLPALFPDLCSLKLCKYRGGFSSLVGLKLLRKLNYAIAFFIDVPEELRQLTLTQVWRLELIADTEWDVWHGEGTI